MIFFHNALTILFNIHAPLKKLSNKETKQTTKPWISNKILSLIATKNSLYGHFMKTGDHSSFTEYRTIRNQLNRDIKKSKQVYYQNYFTSFKHDIKKFWKDVSSMLGNSIKSNIPQTITKNGKTISSPAEIAKEFSQFFTNVTSKLLQKLPK